MAAYRILGIPVASSVPFPGEWNTTVYADDPTMVIVGDLPRLSGTSQGGWSRISDEQKFEAARSENGGYRFLAGAVDDGRQPRPTEATANGLRWGPTGIPG